MNEYEQVGQRWLKGEIEIETFGKYKLTPMQKAFINAKERQVHVCHRYVQNLLNKGRTELAVNHHEQNASTRLARDDEVGLCITDPHSSLYMPGSFVDEGPIGE